MPKTPEELNQLKTEYQTLNTKLAELGEEELEQVSGGNITLEEIAERARQCNQLKEEEMRDVFKAFLEKYGKYYKEMLPKK